jgi:hypothetical protein
MSTYQDLTDRIRGAVDASPESDVLSALATVLVERAVNFERQDGTKGSAPEVKDFIAALTDGMVDIAMESGGAADPH